MYGGTAQGVVLVIDMLQHFELMWINWSAAKQGSVP